MAVVKKCISLPEESFTQLEFLRRDVFHAPANVPLSQLISMAICFAYDDAKIKEVKKMIDNEMRARAGESPACARDQDSLDEIFEKYII